MSLRFGSAVAIALFALASVRANAQDTPAPASPPEALTPPAGGPAAAPTTRIAVLLLATQGVNPSVADDLTEVLVSALAERGGFSIVGKEEFQAQLGQSERGSIECIASVGCIGHVGIQLSVEQAIAGTLARRAGRWVFNLNRIDVRSGDTLGRAFREVEGDLGAVATALQEVLPTLFEVIRRPAIILVSSRLVGAEVSIDGLVIGTITNAEQPVQSGILPSGRHEVIVRAAGHRTYQRAVEVASGATLQLDATPAEGGGVSPLVWIGGGVAIGAGAAALVFALLSQDQPGPMITRAQAVGFYADRQTDATIADVMFAVGGAGLVTALIGLVLTLTSGGGGGEAAPERPRTARLQLSVAPVAGGLALGVGGEL